MTTRSISRKTGSSSLSSSSSKTGLTREERRASGKASRNKLSRTAHADWRPRTNRRDPIDLLIESDKGRLSQLIPIRYSQMTESPFAFFRGAATIIAADLADSSTSGIHVQSCGDCHLMNFGGFATPERRIVFDINDLMRPMGMGCQKIGDQCCHRRTT